MTTEQRQLLERLAATNLSIFPIAQEAIRAALKDVDDLAEELGHDCESFADVTNREKLLRRVRGEEGGTG